ncbi:TetR/AcrR family transcriptional regulator [Spongiactinospora sp. TRM90649]|uniref:TetR/AcrR family transcriptional regulator n=1 Tax=Spongiactinospora sp. TRM90649 TaxID=3031114 RepID=UPI0023F64D52|nr:TetR/AcrR family transcriptional regulator [Spongiactinospora sp. TRM90649]MDF5758838.1 helix-turn-helix domain containing protein [Spongiactinospora sp. TRM90649]
METAQHTLNRRGRRSREEILDAASRMMSARGYAATSLADLGKETGLPKSAIYHHFSSKAGLLAAVMERGARDFFDDLGRGHALLPPGGTSHERLGWYLRRTGEVFTSRQDFLRLFILLKMSEEAPEVAKIVADVRTEGLVHMRDMIRSAFAPEGEEIAGAVADALAGFGVSSFDGAFIAVHADPGRTMAAEMELVIEAMAALGQARVAALRAKGR